MLITLKSNPKANHFFNPILIQKIKQVKHPIKKDILSVCYQYSLGVHQNEDLAEYWKDNSFLIDQA